MESLVPTFDLNQNNGWAATAGPHLSAVLLVEHLVPIGIVTIGTTAIGTTAIAILVATMVPISF